MLLNPKIGKTMPKRRIIKKRIGGGRTSHSKKRNTVRKSEKFEDEELEESEKRKLSDEAEEDLAV